MSKLSEFFEGVAVKQLSAVEVNSEVSNQHEFGGVASLRALLGEVNPDEPRKYFDAKFLYLGESEDDARSDKGVLTWYDSRANQKHRSAEYRLYVPDNSVYEAASEGDLLVIGKRPNNALLVVIIRADSTYEHQVEWLFGAERGPRTFKFIETSDERDKSIGFAERLILEALEIEVEEPKDVWLDALLARFAGGFPTTRSFSNFARSTLPDVFPADNPDEALVLWMEREESLFKTLENHFVQKQLDAGFNDVEDFITFSLSVQNRRKSRAGYALENHLEQIFIDLQVHYDRGKVTENKSTPDFIFPGIQAYHSNNFPKERLLMLGVKSTCKDRWRQVLAEAKKIPDKHLFTLEPGISENQTRQMEVNRLTLVLPQELHKTYTPSQQDLLLNLGEFINIAKENRAH